MILACHNLNKSFGDHLIVRDPSLGVSTIIFWSLFRLGTATVSINAGFFRFSKT